MLARMGRAGESNQPWFLFAHGAGADCHSVWMQHYRQLLENYGRVRTFNYAYMHQGRKRPDRLDALIDTHRRELSLGRKEWGAQAILVGKSMGSRVGCHLAETEQVRGVICFGYPLVSGGSSARLRDQALLKVPAPLCLLQGTRDELCPLELLQGVLAGRKAPTSLHIVPTGDHSLKPTKTYLKQEGLQESDMEGDSMKAIESFLASLT